METAKIWPQGIILLADGVEEMEAVIVLDVLRRASLEIHSVAVSASGKRIRGAQGIELIADWQIEEVEGKVFDFLILPGGGPGSIVLGQDQRVRSCIERHAEASKWVAAICAAPRILDGMNLLKGRRATSFPGESVQGKMKSCHYIDNESEPVVVDGKFVTSRGPGTAFAFALELVQLLTPENGALKVKELKGKLLLR